jgi:Zn-finger nucleic acid-binding protein
MKSHRLPAHYGRTVELDACQPCQLLWLDTSESQQLNSDGVMELFRMVHDSALNQRDKLAQRLGCVRCRSTLKKTHDQVPNARFTYHACTKGHGRLITFYQFLVEKHFVRELSPAERERLAADVQQIRCTGCGAAIDLGKQNACDYCRAPIAVFDRQAAQKAIEHYLERRNRRIPQQQLQPVVLPPTGARVDPCAYTAADLTLDAVWAMAQFASRYTSASTAAGTATSTSIADLAHTRHFDAGDSGGMLDLIRDGAHAFIDALFD